MSSFVDCDHGVDDSTMDSSSPPKATSDANDVELGSSAVQCSECKAWFPSRNKLFQHLPEHGMVTKAAEQFMKIAILVGWISEAPEEHLWVKDGHINSDSSYDSIEQNIWNAIRKVEGNLDSPEFNKPRGFSRATNFSLRASYLYGQEASCHGIADVMTFQVCVNAHHFTTIRTLTHIYIYIYILGKANTRTPV
jgi:hypothetical protein